MDRIWYKKPAEKWLDGLPIGNGEIAGMVFGSYPIEKIALNHEWLWKSKNRHRDVSKKYKYLEKIRKLFFGGKVYEAGKLANEKLGGGGGILAKEKPNRVDPYQPACDFFIQTTHTLVKNYRRELNLETAIVKVNYKVKNNKYEREIFVHSGFPVLVVYIKGKGLNISSYLSRINDPECRIVRKSKFPYFLLSGEFIEGTKFSTLGKIVSDGNVEIKEGEFFITGASKILFLITISVSHNGEDTEEMCYKKIKNIPEEIKILKETHIKDYQKYYKKVYFQIANKDKIDIPTDERIKKVKAGYDDNKLVSLFFNFGRYLLISGSRRRGFL